MTAREASVGHREAALAILLPRLEVRPALPNDLSPAVTLRPLRSTHGALRR